jgi:acid phosphatase (class A)
MRAIGLMLAAATLALAPLADAQTATQQAPAAQATPPAATPLDGVPLIGPPPAPGSFGAMADRAAAGADASRERIALASADQGPNQRPDPFQAFGSVMGRNFTAERYPATARLLGAILTYVGPPIGTTKEHFQRQRPYVAEPQLARCTPAPTEALGPYRSYPSGHAALGYAWSLLLAEALPSRAQGLLERGVDYGRSRVVCNVHWESDVRAGQLLASAAVARAHGDAQFRALIDAARAELAPLAAN